MTTLRSSLGIVSSMAALAMAGKVAADGSAEWRVSIHQTGGSAQGCVQNGKGTLKVSDGALTFFRQGVSYPLWKVGLREDGSAAEVVSYDGRAARKVKVMVTPGVGPRSVEFITQTSICYYRLVPE